MHRSVQTNGSYSTARTQHRALVLTMNLSKIAQADLRHETEHQGCAQEGNRSCVDEKNIGFTPTPLSK